MSAGLAVQSRQSFSGAIWDHVQRIQPRESLCRVRIVIADDHTLLRQGIRTILEVLGDFEVVGEAADGREAMQLAERFVPDVMLVDVAMPLMNGLEATRQIKQRYSSVKILALMTDSQSDMIYPLLAAGASGCILKDSDASELIRALNEIHRGNSYISPSISHSMVWDYLHLAQTGKRRQTEDPLTNREREVLQLIAEGYSNSQIAGMLFLSVKTVEAHKTHITEKLGIRGRGELFKYALKRGLVSIED